MAVLCGKIVEMPKYNIFTWQTQKKILLNSNLSKHSKNALETESILTTHNRDNIN